MTKELGLLERLVVATEKIAAKLGTAALPVEAVKAKDEPLKEKPKKEAPKEKKIQVVDKTKEKKKGPDRTEVTRLCKDYRQYFGQEALIKLWASYDGAESLNDIPEDNYQKLTGDIVDAFQKEILKYGKRVGDAKVIKQLKKDFDVERLMDAKQDYPGMLEAIKAALPKKEEKVEEI